MASTQSGSQLLASGQRIKTMLGETAIVKSLIGQGGQGSVYVVSYAGKDMALKWYRKNVFISPSEFKANLKSNIMAGPPAPQFIWPLDMTADQDDSFGYIMELRPKGYYEATEFLLHNVTFASFRRAVDACLNVVSAFRQLHNAGYSYKDINGGNFFFDPKTGKALICDNDNVAPSSVQTGIIGTPRFMAPEVVTRQTMPNGHSDRHSMSVLLFMLLCMGHPLEGSRSLCPVLGAAQQLALYGTDPVFMMDPDNHVNAPNEIIHRDVVRVWDCFPQYMRDIFVRAFSHDALTNPQTRPTEKDWLKALVRFRSDMITCSCGNEVFTEGGAGAVCDACGKPVRSACRLKLKDLEYSIPLVYDTRLYRVQVGVCNADEALDPIAQVVRSGGSKPVLGLRNASKQSWNAITSKGDRRPVAPGEVIPIKPGIQFTVETETAQILSNQ